MAFGYKYWMVLLPEFNRESFLVFVHNPGQQTKLRDYSSGHRVVLGQPTVEYVFGEAEEGRSRFHVDPHLTTDHHYWHQRTLEFNTRYLSSALRNVTVGASTSRRTDSAPESQGSRSISGRAHRGSRCQIQDYVNLYPDRLSECIFEALPRLRGLGVRIDWVSPLASNDYTEYRDADFLRAVGLEEAISDLKWFWPARGPSWDALARTLPSATGTNVKRGVILVEAKSHLNEIYGNGCQASSQSRLVIERAISETKRWCAATDGANWMGPLYQSANRLAHLYFFRERLKSLQRPVWLFNLYFLDDPIGPATREEWITEIRNIKISLGLTQPVPNVFDVFLPALGDQPNVVSDADRLV